MYQRQAALHGQGRRKPAVRAVPVTAWRFKAQTAGVHGPVAQRGERTQVAGGLPAYASSARLQVNIPKARDDEDGDDDYIEPTMSLINSLVILYISFWGRLPQSLEPSLGSSCACSSCLLPVSSTCPKSFWQSGFSLKSFALLLHNLARFL